MIIGLGADTWEVKRGWSVGSAGAMVEKRGTAPGVLMQE